MLTAEDDIAATVVPRLIAAGADLARIFFLSITRDERGDVVPFHLSDDCERLRLKCQEIGHVALVVVDPLVSFLGSRTGRTLNTYNDMEVRKALAPLKELAERTRAAVAAIRHSRKNKGTDAMEAGGGSVAVVREIYERFAGREGARSIALALNRSGALSPRAQQGRPNGWSASSVRAVLERPLYRGEVVYGKTAKAYGRELGTRNGKEKGMVPKPEANWLRREAPELRMVDPDVAGPDRAPPGGTGTARRRDRQPREERGQGDARRDHRPG